MQYFVGTACVHLIPLKLSDVHYKVIFSKEVVNFQDRFDKDPQFCIF